MNQFFNKILLLLFVAGSSTLFAQTIVHGTVKDDGTLGNLAGVNIVVKGTINGTITDSDGKYSLKVNQLPPFIIMFSYLGFHTEEVVIKENNTSYDLHMKEESMMGQEIIVSASRMEENILKSPVTIEKMDVKTIRQSATPDFYDAIANMNGVQVSNSSLNFTSVNTRGFADILNTRFVQLVDGMDMADPMINFPTGSILGLGELDAESLELLPGAASALYGPNAFNGIIIMKSKSPFKYPGLSLMVKQGFTNSNAGGTHPLGIYSLRYAKEINTNLAFKVNFYSLLATDWTSNDHKTDRNDPNSKMDLSQTQNFDGLNLYGDETPIPINNFGIGTIRRTGISETTLLENKNATTLKWDAAIHYRIGEKIELIGVYRYGKYQTISQADAKYALRPDQQFYKLELKGDKFFIMGYASLGDAGKTYNMDALGALVNEYFNPTGRPDGSGWVQDYVLAFLGSIPGIKAGDPSSARSFADRFMINSTTGQYVPSLQDTINKVRSNFFQKYPPGASFQGSSRMWHSEFYYNFKQIKWAEIIVGGNFRKYSLFTNGTLLDDSPLDVNNPKRIIVNSFGSYVQISKNIAKYLKLTGSIRYDNMDNFDGHLTPRVSVVYTLKQNHNFRANFQTGFRFPDMFSQFLYFNNPSGILLGGARSNASPYGINNGGAWTETSYNSFASQGGTLDPNTGAILTNPGNVTLETAHIEFIKPEQLRSYEIGYKGLITSQLLVDLNYYYTTYSNFIGGQHVRSKVSTSHLGQQINAGALWFIFHNSPYTLNSNGIGLGLIYNLPKNFVLTGNYNYTSFSGQQSSDFLSLFNTPSNRYSIGIGNKKLVKNLGFNINFRYHESFLWQSSYGEAIIPSNGVLDAQVNYNFKSIKTLVKIGATNLGGGDYRTNFGAPYIGQTYYVSLVFN